MCVRACMRVCVYVCVRVHGCMRVCVCVQLSQQGAVTQLIEQPEPQSHTAVSSLGRWLPFVAGTVRSVLCANRKLVHGLTARLGSPVSMLLQVGKQAYREVSVIKRQESG